MTKLPQKRGLVCISAQAVALVADHCVHWTPAAAVLMLLCLYVLFRCYICAAKVTGLRFLLNAL